MDYNPEDLHSLFNPKSVAVIGASNNQNKVGGQIIANLILGGYQGRVYPVNPKGEMIFNYYQSYKNIKKVPSKVDLALITIPNDRVPPVLEECVEENIGFVIIITAGFREIARFDKQGYKLNEELIKITSKGSTRLIGPNCMGVASSESNMLALMGWSVLPPKTDKEKNKISITSQSGTWGIVTMGQASNHGLGFSKLISNGNELDLTLEDFVEYYGLYDDDTDIILCFIEGLRNGKKFKKIAKEITLKKPIIILKGGKTLAGSKAASSHTGSISGSRIIYDSVFKQYGVIQAENSTDLVDIARGLAVLMKHDKMPKGRRTAIYTGGGGAGVLAADFCAEFGLEMATLSEETIRKLDAILPPYWSKGNPVDLVATRNFKAFTNVLKILTEDPNIDIIIANLPLGISYRLKQPHIQKILEKLPKNIFKPELLKAFDDSISSTLSRIAKHTNKTIISPVGLYQADLPFEPEIISKVYQKGVYIVNSSWNAARLCSKIVEYCEFLKKNKK
ncbi:MAG: acetate--CoA ligase family protein [Candidatus Helarchaeota archaeon]